MAMSTTSTDRTQTNQSCLVQLDSKGNIQWISSLNPNPIQLYATELWESLSEKDTAITPRFQSVKRVAANYPSRCRSRI